MPEYRTASLVYYDLRNQPLVGMNIEQAELLGASKLPNAIAELETSKQLSLTSGPMLDLINHLTGRSHSHVVYKAVVAENSIHTILVGVRNRIGEFLDDTILELEYGTIPENVFENIREVDSKMVEMCPDAINKLQVIYENVSSGSTSEYWSHVASS